MTFSRFKRSGKIPSKKDKLTMRQTGSESTFLKFPRITRDMLFGPAALFALRNFITQFRLGALDARKKIFYLGSLDNLDMCGLFGDSFYINLSVIDVKNLLKWLAMALSSVVITLLKYKLICRDFFVFLLLLMIALIASNTFF